MLTGPSDHRLTIIIENSSNGEITVIGACYWLKGNLGTKFRQDSSPTAAELGGFYGPKRHRYAPSSYYGCGLIRSIIRWIVFHDGIGSGNGPGCHNAASRLWVLHLAPGLL